MKLYLERKFIFGNRETHYNTLKELLFMEKYTPSLEVFVHFHIR